MAKYEISDVTNNDLRKSQRMLAQHPKILGALEEVKLKKEFFEQVSASYNLKEPQRMMILHVTGSIDWNQTREQIANKFGFSDAAIRQLYNYIKYQEIISSVIGWDRLIDLMVFVIQGRYSIRSFYQDLFLKIKERPPNQWSDIMARVIQEIRSGKPLKYMKI